MVALSDPNINLLIMMVLFARGIKPLVTTPKKVYGHFNQGCKLDRRKVNHDANPTDGLNRRRAQKIVLFGYQSKHLYYLFFGLFLILYIIVSAFSGFFKFPFKLN